MSASNADTPAAPEPAFSQGPMTRLRLDSHTSEPYYQQLKRQIQQLIAAGDLPAGSNLPSERLLAETLHVSRTTIKRCYNDLRKAQLLSTHGRGGTLVQAPQPTPAKAGKLKSFAEEMQELGRVASTQLVTQDVLQDRMIASIFGRPSVTSFLRLVRLRLADGVPLAHEVAWYDLALTPPMAHWDTQGSAYACLREQCGLTLSSTQQTIEAVMSSQAEAEAFGYTTPSPCLLLKRKTFSSDQQLAEYVESTFRGDTYAYQVSLTP